MTVDAQQTLDGLLTDPKVAATVRWWRRRQAWGLDWLEQDEVLWRAYMKTAQGHDGSRQDLNSSFSRVLGWETKRELKRKLRRAHHFQDDRLEDRPAPTELDGWPAERSLRLWTWVERYLSAGEQAVVRLVYHEGRSYEAAADLLGISVDTVASRARTAIGRLRAVAESGGWCPTEEPKR